MSFEGYVMTLCLQGHLLEEPYDYAGDQHTVVCPCCGEKWIWSYVVDQTNNSGVQPVLELLAPAVDDDDGVYYLPVDVDTSSGPGPDHPPVKAVQWVDNNHPDDGPLLPKPWRGRTRTGATSSR